MRPCGCFANVIPRVKDERDSSIGSGFCRRCSLDSVIATPMATFFFVRRCACLVCFRRAARALHGAQSCRDWRESEEGGGLRENRNFVPLAFAHWAPRVSTKVYIRTAACSQRARMRSSRCDERNSCTLLVLFWARRKLLPWKELRSQMSLWCSCLRDRHQGSNATPAA